MDDHPLPWKLQGFPEAIEAWIERDDSDDDTQLNVVSWVMSRHDDPYDGMRREDGFENLWFGRVRWTAGEDRRAVHISYWIDESIRVVRCDSIATLGMPF